MDSRKISFWRWLALLLTLLLVPAICVMAAFASQLQITSPYFSLSFGPPRLQGEPPLIVLTGGPNLPPVVNVGPPNATPPPGTGGPQQPPPGNNPAGTTSCLLGLLCLSADASLGSSSILNVDLGKDATTPAGSLPGLGQGSNQCLLGVLCVSTGLQPTASAASQGAQNTASSPGCKGVACVDLGVNGQGNGVTLELGAELPVVGSQLNTGGNNEGVQLDLDADLLENPDEDNDDLNINLLDAVQVGVGGGSGGVSIGLSLPGLFP